MNFDWVTFGFQIVNVLVLLAILRHFLFRPVADIIARRQSETDKALQAAEDARTEAAAATARAKAEADTTAAARHDVLVKAQAEAEQTRQTLLDKAREEAAKIVADGKTNADRQAREVGARTLGRARDLATAIAGRALAAQPKDFAGYVETLAGALNRLSPEERAALLSGVDLRLAAPAPLSAEEQAVVRKALAPFGISPANEIDPSLIAGLEIRSGNGSIRNSLAHDLDQLTEALRDDRTS